MSKALNELKKATLASYLSKAGSRVRTGTKIGLDFENDAYKDMAVANKHHPNMVTPGFEKDPEKRAAAEKSMKTNFDLAKTFKRDAANRIKGIARAGRLLAKEEVEQLDERNTESHPDLWNSHELVHKSGKVLKKGDVVKGFRGHYKVHGFEMPHHSGSTGRVYVHSVNAKGRKIPGSGYGMDGNEPQSFFPSVIDAKIQKKAVKEEVVNELKTSTLASVATKRYQQAQAALKDKDYGGYVKAKAKSMKAADATVPKSGWSPEDDKKNEEVVPTISPQERYRQIKEAKLAKAAKPTTTHHNFYIKHEDTDEAAGVLAQHKIPHSVADHSRAPVDHSIVSVRHKHYAAAKEAFKKHGVDFGGR
jgi:hypothetical protein